MKEGLSLQELASKVSYVGKHKADYVVPMEHVQWHVTKDELKYRALVPGHEVVVGNMTDLAMRQTCTELGIPASYRNTLMDKGRPDLLTHNMNELTAQHGKARMIRTVNDHMRANVSPSFSLEYDNDFIMRSLMGAVAEVKGLQVESCNLSESRMALKIVSPRLEGEVGVGDPVQMGISVFNSDVGVMAYSDNEFWKRLICDNGMTRMEKGAGFRAIHKGIKQDMGVVFRKETLEAQRTAVTMQIRDRIVSLLDPARFALRLEQMKEVAERKINAKHLDKKVEALGKIVTFTKDEGEDILKHLIEGGDLSQWGMLNAVTRYSQDVEDYDRASELEAIGGRVLTLSPKQWETVKEAA